MEGTLSLSENYGKKHQSGNAVFFLANSIIYVLCGSLSSVMMSLAEGLTSLSSARHRRMSATMSGCWMDRIKCSRSATQGSELCTSPPGELQN